MAPLPKIILPAPLSTPPKQPRLPQALNVPAASRSPYPVKLMEFTGVRAVNVGYNFTPIPPGFRFVQIVGMIQTDQATAQLLYWQANGDGGANYDMVLIFAGTTSALGKFSYSTGTNVEFARAMPNSRSGTFDAKWIDYSSTAPWKSSQSTGSGDTATEFEERRYTGQWRSAAPITSLRVYTATGGTTVASWAAMYGYP